MSRKDRTRQRLLDAGILEIARNGLPLLRLPRVADAIAVTGFTTGAAYNIWPEQSLYHEDLCVELVRTIVELQTNEVNWDLPSDRFEDWNPDQIRVLSEREISRLVEAGDAIVRTRNVPRELAIEWACTWPDREDVS